MKKRGELWTLAGLVLTGLLIAGCSEDQIGPGDGGSAPVGVTTEEQAIEYYAVNNEFVANEDETFSDREVTAADAGSFGKIDDAVTPIRFGRFITSLTRTVETTYEDGDEIAIAHITKEITGVFKILALNEANEMVMIEKPFTDKAQRDIVFTRVAHDPVHFWRNWVPVSTSLVKGGTLPPNDQVKITLVEITLNGETISITDPLTYYMSYGWMGEQRLRAGLRKGDVPELTGGQPIQLRVTLESSMADEEFVAVRYGYAGLSWRRLPMTLTEESENGGVYTRVYEITASSPLYMHFHRGWFNLGIDAVTNGTLYDDQAPYSASWWGIPYRVF